MREDDILDILRDGRPRTIPEILDALGDTSKGEPRARLRTKAHARLTNMSKYGIVKRIIVQIDNYLIPMWIINKEK